MEGKTGFVLDSLDAAVLATEKLQAIHPEDCRRNTEDRFSAKTMAQGYERVYRRLASR